MSPQFIHLHLHTEYSISDGLIRINSLIETCVKQKMAAVAVTDHINLFAAVKFFKQAIAHGIKPIIGAEIIVANPDNPKRTYELVLLCQNQQGYKNLMQLISRAYVERQETGIPIIQRDWLIEAERGLILLSAGPKGDVGQALLAGNITLAEQAIAFWSNVFPKRYYLEVIRTGRKEEGSYNNAVIDLARNHGIPIVASNDVRFLQQADYEAHEARVCINQGRILNDPQRPQIYSDQQYLRNSQEMTELFSDLPEAISNTVEIAKRCNVWLTLDNVYLPRFPTPENITLDEYLIQQAKIGLEKRLRSTIYKNTANFAELRIQYDDRLTLELNVIIAMGYAGYFLIVADFIQWARTHGVPVGPGRGSGAGSLVAYVLNITDLDPLQYDLLFERFLNPERVSMPDFDIDFCMEGRDRVIEYVINRYGSKSVSQIITFGTMAAKAVVRDVGRVLGYPYGFVDKIAKLIPFELGITLDKALKQEEALRERYEQEEDVRSLIDLARRLEGIVRNAGKHAGGVVIAPTELTDFVPLYCEAGSHQLVSQFDKDDVEAIGLVKFDFLGLRTLTIIDRAIQTINEERKRCQEPLLDLDQIPLGNDAITVKLLHSCATTSIFQLESRGMTDLMKRLKPDCFADIIPLIALFRPGPLQSGMVDDFISRKHGRTEIQYLHSSLEPILRPTYGVILYQEQVMQIAQTLAGYTLGGADILRRAMGKKKPAEMMKQRIIFLDGSVKKGVASEIASQIFDLMEKFAGYGFNKSHSAAYALISYHTAWLKANYPAAFMAAVLSAEMNNTDKIVHIINECQRMKLTISPPNINQSAYHFTVLDGQTILYGLGAIKGIGEAAIENIISNRAKEKFKGLYDFCMRVNLRKTNRRVLECFIKAGAFDDFGVHRASLMASIDNALRQAEQHNKNLLHGQNDLFGLFDHAQQQSVSSYQDATAWSYEECLSYEKEALGLYISGHPFDRYKPELAKLTTTSLINLPMQTNQSVIIAGYLVSLRTHLTKRGDRFAFITLDDGTARIEIAVFADVYKKHQELLQMDQVLIVQCEVNYDEQNANSRLTANRLYTLDQSRQNFAKYLLIKLHSASGITELMPQLQQSLIPFCKGTCPVVVDYQNERANLKINLGNEWHVTLCDELIQSLNGLLGEQGIEVCY